MPENLHIIADPDKYGKNEHLYLETRKKEGRIYSDEIVKSLPHIETSHRLSHEWSVRSASYERLKKRLLTRKAPLSILDLGCGNGWMANALCGICDSSVTGVDLNMEELKQGARVFGGNSRLRFVYGDVFDGAAHANSYDIVVCASSIQYFQDLNALVRHLLTLLKAGGEIHILDSPLYSEAEAGEARERSRSYYRQLGYERMAALYHHHTWKELEGFSYEVIRAGIVERLKAKIFSEMNPFFPWIIIQSHKSTGTGL